MPIPNRPTVSGRPEIDPARQISAAHDSVNLINKIITAGVFGDSEKDTLRRNKEHLAIIARKDYAVDFPSDVDTFNAAIDAASSAIG